MALSYCDSVIDFDLDILQQSGNGEAISTIQNTKQNKAVLRLKERIISTESVIKRYSKKKLQLQEIQKKWKKVCVDYSDALKKLNDLENDLQSHKQQVEKLNKFNAELQQSYEYAETAKLAFKAHVVQLQMLIKEHEQRIETLKCENKAAGNKDTKLQQEYNKKLFALVQQNKQLLYHIQIFRTLIIENKKPNIHQKRILKKYESAQYTSDIIDLNDNKNNAERAEGMSDFIDNEHTKSLTLLGKVEEDKHESLEKISNPVKKGNIAYGSNMLEICIKPSCLEVEGKIVAEISKNKIIDACAFDIDSEVSNEPAFSVDTGCGSSLACSDVEKEFFSPEYSVSNSPLSIDSLMMRKEVAKVVSVATSPITVPYTQDAGTDPIRFFDCKSIGIQHDVRSEDLNIHRSSKNVVIQCDILSKQLCKNVEVQCELKSINKEVKSVNTQCDGISEKVDSGVKQYLEVATQSDFIFQEVNNLDGDKKSSLTESAIKSPNRKCKCVSKKRHIIDKQKSLPSIAEEEPLNQDEIDSEVTTILNEMRLDFGKITPIPLSPVPYSNKDNSSISHLESDNQTLSSQLLILTKTVTAIVSALKVRGINVNDNIIVDAADSSKGKKIPSEKDVTEVFDNNFKIYAQEADVKKASQNVCNLVNKNGEKSQNISVFETDNNLEQSFTSEQQANETFEMEDTLNNVNPESLISSFPKKVKDNQNNGNKLYEKERTKIIRKGKITKLQKMRRSVLPKYKIKKELLPRSISPKILNKNSVARKESNKKLNSIEILNNKAAYEKALRVVAEMRQKEKDALAKKFGKKTIFLKPNKKLMLVPSKQIQCPDTQSKRLLHDTSDTTQKKCSNLNTNKSFTSSICLTTSFNESLSNDNDSLQISNKNIDISKLNTNIKKCSNLDESGGDRNACNREYLEDRETIKKHEARKNANLGNKSLLPLVIPNKKQCKIPDSIFLNNQERSLVNTVMLNKSGAIRQSERLSTKRLSAESEVKDENSKRQKRNSLNSEQCVYNDKTLTSDNSTASVRESSMHNIKLNALLNHSLVQIHRLSREEIEKNVKRIDKSKDSAPVNKTDKHVNSSNNNINSSVKSYYDLDMFSENTNAMADCLTQNHNSYQSPTIQKGYFCQIMDKYLKNKKNPKPLSEKMIKNIYMELDRNIIHIINLQHNEVNEALKTFAESMQNVNVKHFVAAIVAYLQSPKKLEDVICKTSTPPAPPMAKSEQILLYLLKHLNNCQANVNIFDMVMNSIAYKLFKLNKLTPSFEEVESLSHFYAVLCRYTRAKNRLRQFILDAMYCLSYKAMTVIKQCLDVWMHILPLAHMGLAKSPLVVTLVYLLHFYRCDDKSGRVQNIRILLRKRYSYDMGDWNETKILEMFQDAITHMREIPVEKKMLRTSLILIAKRNGVEWCQKNIVKKLLLPMIENKNAPETVRAFCVSVLGAVMRPYPKHMRLHCEIAVNQLFIMLDQEGSPQIQEAVFTSLVYLSRHSLNRIVGALLTWKPLKVSPALEELLKDFVQEKPVKSWYYILSQHAK